MGSIGLALALHQDKMLAAPVRPELEAKVFDLTPKKTGNQTQSHGYDFPFHAGWSQSPRYV